MTVGTPTRLLCWVVTKTGVMFFGLRLQYKRAHEFQEILAKPDGLEKFQELMNLAMDFTYASKLYAKIIISELNVTEDYRTIHPCNVGGIAGGLCGILY